MHGNGWNIADGIEAKLAGRHVLVVEDEALLAIALQATLEEAGAEVVGPAQSMATALRLAEHEQIDAAILDITIGGERVWPLAHTLRQRGIPILFYTGWHDAVALVGEWPESAVVAKPAPDGKLIAALADLVDQEMAPAATAA